MLLTDQSASREASADRADTNPVLANPRDTAEGFRQQLRRQGRTDWELVCVIGDDGLLLGTLTAAQLLVLADETVVGGVAKRELPRVVAETDQEKMASIALHHHVAAMPVVDASGRLIGVVGSTTLMEILRREHGVQDLPMWHASRLAEMQVDHI